MPPRGHVKPSESARPAIAKALADDPIRTVAELSQIGNCSRQRVHQILKADGIKLPSISEIRRARGIKIIPTPRVEVDGPMAGVSHSCAGTISELLAAADLSARGWTVFFPLVRTAKCDLIILSQDGAHMRRIEVRSGRRIKGGSLNYNRSKHDVCDHHAVVLAGEPIIYLPPLTVTDA